MHHHTIHAMMTCVGCIREAPFELSPILHTILDEHNSGQPTFTNNNKSCQYPPQSLLQVRRVGTTLQWL